MCVEFNKCTFFKNNSCTNLGEMAKVCIGFQLERKLYQCSWHGFILSMQKAAVHKHREGFVTQSFTPQQWLCNQCSSVLLCWQVILLGGSLIREWPDKSSSSVILDKSLFWEDTKNCFGSKPLRNFQVHLGNINTNFIKEIFWTTALSLCCWDKENNYTQDTSMSEEVDVDAWTLILK